MKNFTRFLFVICLTLFSFQMMAQEVITGQVTDSETGETLPGVNVVVEGTTIGTITDFDGNYRLEVPSSNSVIVFSYVGMNEVRLQLSGQNELNVPMTSGLLLNDVVVTALGIKREKKSLGYATQEVKGDEVSKVKSINAIESLSGKVAGLDVKRSSTLGGSANVIVRGYTSISQNNQALFVVDGVPISNRKTNTTDMQTGRGGYDFGNAAMDINPDDIESINVLKGAAATALYGSRAANGAIIITTKQGTTNADGSDAIGVSAGVSYTVGTVDQTTLPSYQKEYGPGYSNVQGWYSGAYAPDPIDGLDYDTYFGNEAFIIPNYDDASFGAPFDPNLQVYNWQSFYPQLPQYQQTTAFTASTNDAQNSFFQRANALNTNVAFDGGGEKAAYRLSYTHSNNTGILENSNIKRNTVALGGSYDLTSRLKASSTLNYVVTEGRGRYGTGYDNRNPNQSFRQWYNTDVDVNAVRDAYELTGENISWNPYGIIRPGGETDPHYFDNYFFNLYENVPTDQRNRIFGNVKLEYKINDLLSVMARATTDRYDEIQEERIAVGSVDVSKYEKYDGKFEENNYDLHLYFNDTYLDDSENVSISGLIGTNILRSKFSSTRAETNGGLVSPGLYSFSNSVSAMEAPDESAWRKGVNGYFAQATLGLANMVYLDLTGRYDISSTLPESDWDYFYPSASLSWVFSELMSGSNNAFDFGKLRLNYAEVGSDAPALRVFDIYSANSPFGGSALASATGAKNNPELVPERTKSYEAGVELNFFNRRVGLDVSYYLANTFDLITNAPVTGATGNTSKWINAGQIENKGWETIINLNPVRRNGFRWDIDLTWARNRSKVIDLFDGADNFLLNTAQGGFTLNATIGEPFGTIRGSNYVFDDAGNPIVYPHWNGGVRYRKTASPETVGDINPDWIGGIKNRISYKGVGLNFLIDIKQGGDVFSLDQWYGTATGIYENSAGTNSVGNPVRDLPNDEDPSAGGGIFIDGAVMHATDANGDFVYDEDGNPVGGEANTMAFYASDVYTSLGYVYAPLAHHVYDASFVKLREVSLSYGLPDRLFKSNRIAGADISLIGRNLWIISSNMPYSDPEAGLSAGLYQGNQSGAYPSVKEIGASLNLKF